MQTHNIDENMKSRDVNTSFMTYMLGNWKLYENGFSSMS